VPRLRRTVPKALSSAGVQANQPAAETESDHQVR
jgi:hypothetical protein